MLSGTDISAFAGSRIGRSTIEAYLATEYRIAGERPMVLRIGARSEGLDTLFGALKVSSAAVLTAWNPYSAPTADEQNSAWQNELIGEIDRLGLRHLSSHGADPTGAWPPEDSRLILGVDLETARSLGNRFRQNGFVWAAADAVPRLILLH